MSDKEQFEQITETFTAGNRIYTFEIKKSENGFLYLNIIENNTKKSEFHKVMVFEEDINKFTNALMRVLKKVIITDESQGKQTTTYLDTVRKDYGNAYKVWTKEEEQLLLLLLSRGVDHNEIAKRLQRKKGAITSRIRKLRTI